MKKIILLFAIVLLLPMPGCIDEDFKNCSQFLYFSYVGDGTDEIFLDKTGKVNLYVYDRNSELVKSMEINRKELEERQGVFLGLPDGKYRVICWGNAYDDTEIRNESDISTGIVGAPLYFTDALRADNNAIRTNDSLYYGSREIEIFNNRNQVDTVRFKSAHIKMLVLLSGLNDMALPDGSSPIDIQVSNLSPTVDFDYNFSEEKVSYYPSLHYDNATTDFKARFNVLRFNDENDIFIRLINKETDQQIYQLSLSEFMSGNDITVDGINEIMVGIRFRFNGTNVIIMPWDEVNITPGFK